MKFHVGQVFQALGTCTSCPHGAEIREGRLVCTMDGLEIRPFDASYACPAGLWRSRLMDPKAYVKLPGPTQSKFEDVKATWRMFTPPPRGGDAALMEARLATCESCPKVKDDHCGECTCPPSPVNLLDGKLGFEEVRCPLGKW